MKENLDLKNPKTFNQKLQWLKIHNIDPKYEKMTDKYEVRKIIKEIVGEEFLIPLLGVWNYFDEIDFEKMPNQFVLKPNHLSGSVVVCRDKSTFNINEARKILTRALRKNYFYGGRETPYKNIKPRIIAENYMVDESGEELKDYKFFCFNGSPKLFFVATGRNIGKTKFDFFDLDYNHLPFTNGHGNANIPIMKPKNFNQMVEIAKKLSEGIPHVRVDLYNVDGKIYFGEYTFHHWGGIVPFEPREWDEKIGEMIDII
jgi:hypothetical protein